MALHIEAVGKRRTPCAHSFLNPSPPMSGRSKESTWWKTLLMGSNINATYTEPGGGCSTPAARRSRPLTPQSASATGVTLSTTRRDAGSYANEW